MIKNGSWVLLEHFSVCGWRRLNVVLMLVWTGLLKNKTNQNKLTPPPSSTWLFPLFNHRYAAKGSSTQILKYPVSSQVKLHYRLCWSRTRYYYEGTRYNRSKPNGFICIYFPRRKVSKNKQPSTFFRNQVIIPKVHRKTLWFAVGFLEHGQLWYCFHQRLHKNKAHIF